jgi:hypothetical protein
VKRTTASREPIEFWEAAKSLYEREGTVTAPAVTLMVLSVELLLKWHIWPGIYGYREERARAHTELRVWRTQKGNNGHDLIALAEKAKESEVFKGRPKHHRVLVEIQDFARNSLKTISENVFDTRYSRSDGGDERPCNSKNPFEMRLDANDDPTLTIEEFERLSEFADYLLRVDEYVFRDENPDWDL